MTRDDLLHALQSNNVQAFLHVLREGESSQDESAFTELWGGSHFESFDDHPRKHFPLPGGQTTSAAGAFQETESTWNDFTKLFGPMPFTPENQALCAVWLIARAHALEDVIAGRLHAAILRLSKVWTSLALPKRQAQAAEVFLAYGGTLADETPQTVVAPVPIVTPQVKPMLAALIPLLFQVAPDLIRLFGGGPMSERNAAVAQKVADVAVQVTGAVNEQAAVQALQSDPDLAQKFRAAVTENFDQWLGMMVKFAEMDEASKAKTRDFLSTYDRAPVLFRFTFVELLSLSMVLASVAGGAFVLWDPMDKFTTEMQTAVVMLMLIGGWNGVKEFWLGSSMGSRTKDAAAAQAAK